MRVRKRKRTADDHDDVPETETAETTRCAKMKKISEQTLDLGAQLPEEEAPSGQRLALVVLKLVDAYARAARQNIEHATEFAHSVGSDLPTLKATLAAAWNHVQNIQRLVNSHDVIKIQPRNRRKVPTGAVPAVFDVLEVAEQIFVCLDPLDLLPVRQTCKPLRDKIDASSKVQKHLFLAPDQVQHSRYLDYNNWPIDVYKFYFAALFRYGTLKPGSLVQQMQISQPPICALEYSASCCGLRRYYGYLTSNEVQSGETRLVTNSEGLTVGDLQNAAQAMMADHRLCFYATPFDHDNNGFVRAHIHFSCEFAFSGNEPLAIKLKRDTEVQWKTESKQRSIESYMSAKRAAHDQGLPIPTLAEFEASRVREETA